MPEMIPEQEAPSSFKALMGCISTAIGNEAVEAHGMRVDQAGTKTNVGANRITYGIEKAGDNRPDFKTGSRNQIDCSGFAGRQQARIQNAQCLALAGAGTAEYDPAKYERMKMEMNVAAKLLQGRAPAGAQEQEVAAALRADKEFSERLQTVKKVNMNLADPSGTGTATQEGAYKALGVTSYDNSKGTLEADLMNGKVPEGTEFYYSTTGEHRGKVGHVVRVGYKIDPETKEQYPVMYQSSGGRGINEVDLRNPTEMKNFLGRNPTGYDTSEVVEKLSPTARESRIEFDAKAASNGPAHTAYCAAALYESAEFGKNRTDFAFRAEGEYQKGRNAAMLAVADKAATMNNPGSAFSDLYAARMPAEAYNPLAHTPLTQGIQLAWADTMKVAEPIPFRMPESAVLAQVNPAQAKAIVQQPSPTAREALLASNTPAMTKVKVIRAQPAAVKSASAQPAPAMSHTTLAQARQPAEKNNVMTKVQALAKAGGNAFGYLLSAQRPADRAQTRSPAVNSAVIQQAAARSSRA